SPVQVVVIARRAPGRLRAAEDSRVPPSRRLDVAYREDWLGLDAHGAIVTRLPASLPRCLLHGARKRVPGRPLASFTPLNGAHVTVISVERECPRNGQ